MNHYIRNCSEFLKLSPVDRTTRAKQLNLCINCLRFGHKNFVCKLSNCRKCNGRHNTLLHHPKPELGSRQNQREYSLEETSNQSTTLTTFNANSNGGVLLSTALIQVTGKNNELHTARAILDSASESSFVTSEFCNKLNLNFKDVKIAVSGINNVKSKINRKCDLNIMSFHTPFKTNVTCFVIDNISGILPGFPVNASKLNIPNNITLADASFSEPGHIDILIGAELFFDLLCIGQIKLGPGLPLLQKTLLDYIKHTMRKFQYLL